MQVQCFNSFRKLLRRLDDHLARPNLSKYHIFYGSSDTIQWTFPMVTFVVQPHKRLIRSNGTKRDLNWSPIPSLNTYKFSQHIPCLLSISRRTFCKHLIEATLSWSDLSVTTMTLSFFIYPWMLKWQHAVEMLKHWLPK